MKVRSLVVGLIASAALSFMGCNSADNTHPTVYIDRSFTDAEMEPMIHGITSWERGTDSQITFDIHIVSHEELLQLIDAKIFNNTFFYAKRSDLLNQPCPAGAETEGHAAMTHHKTATNNSYTCFDAVQLNLASSDYFDGEWQHWTVWSIVSAHETGHALKLAEHWPTKDSVMYPDTNVPSYDITCVDVRRVSAMWGLNVSDKCK